MSIFGVGVGGSLKSIFIHCSIIPLSFSNSKINFDAVYFPCSSLGKLLALLG